MPSQGFDGELAERIDGVGADAREHLHPVVGRAGFLGIRCAPLADDRPDLFRSVELGDAKLAEMIGDTVEPGAPVVAWCESASFL